MEIDGKLKEAIRICEAAHTTTYIFRFIDKDFPMRYAIIPQKSYGYAARDINMFLVMRVDPDKKTKTRSELKENLFSVEYNYGYNIDGYLESSGYIKEFLLKGNNKNRYHIQKDDYYKAITTAIRDGYEKISCLMSTGKKIEVEVYDGAIQEKEKG